MAKIGSEHAGAMWRQGLRELRGAMYPESNVAQQAEYGIYGTSTPERWGRCQLATSPNRCLVDCRVGCGTAVIGGDLAPRRQNPHYRHDGSDGRYHKACVVRAACSPFS